MMTHKRGNSPFFAEWTVSELGYRWQDGGLTPLNERLTVTQNVSDPMRRKWDVRPVETHLASDLRWLVINYPGPAEGTRPDPVLRLGYDPLREPSLHRQFAHVYTDEAEVIRFARRYGFLGRQTLLLSHDDEARGRTWGETLDHWVKHSSKMAAIIALWTCYLSIDPKSLDELRSLTRLSESFIEFHWSSDDLPHLAAQHFIMGTSIAELFPILDPDIRLRSATRLLLRDLVNDELGSGTRAAIDIKSGAPVVLLPNDLLGALYVSLAEEITGKKRAAVACACGRYFIPEHGRQKYCEPRCKFKNYRDGKKGKAEANNGE